MRHLHAPFTSGSFSHASTKENHKAEAKAKPWSETMKQKQKQSHGAKPRRKTMKQKQKPSAAKTLKKRNLRFVTDLRG